MRNTLLVLVRFFNRPSIHIITGILIIFCGFVDLEEGIEEFSNSNFAGDRIGLLFLGISTLLMKGSVTFFKFFESTTRGASEMNFLNNSIVRSMQKVSGHWLFELGGGVLLLICGGLEVYENILKNNDNGGNHLIWFVGLIAVGAVKILTFLPEIIEATIIFSHVEHKKGWKMNVLHRVSSKLRMPQVEISLALFLIVLGITEEFLLPLMRDGYSFQLSMHHGIFLFGLTHFSRIMPNFLASKMLFQDAFSEVA